MDPVAEHVSTHCASVLSLVVLSLENGREYICGRAGFFIFFMPEGISQ